MAKVIYRTETFGEGDWHVALCPELGISRTSETLDDAKASVHEAVEAYLRECEWQGILDGVLTDSGFEKSAGVWRLAKRAVEECAISIDNQNGAVQRDFETGGKGYAIQAKDGASWKVTRLSKQDIMKKLAELEDKYGMTTREFARKYHTCGFEEENLEFLDWIWYFDSAAELGIVRSETRK